MITKAVLLATLLTGLAAPAATWADDADPQCVAVPANTVGAHIEVGDTEVHVPALSNIKVCAVVAPPVGSTIPAELTLYGGCGLPCFRLLVESETWTVASTRVTAWLSYTADGVPTQVLLVDEPLHLAVRNENPVCVAVGSPIPECPEDSFVVPVPVPL